MKKLIDFLSFRGKTTVITGAANGIGKAISYRFAEVGSDLILLDTDRKHLEQLKKDLSTYDIEVKVFHTNLSDKKEIDQFWHELDNIQVDILINNAGVYPFMKFEDLDEASLEKVMHVNLYAVIWMCQHFIIKNLKKGGAIINMGSIEAILPFKKDLTQYSLSKVGVITLTRDLAKEYAGKNFNINCILPGGILTKGTKQAAKQALKTLDFGLVSDGYNFKQRIPANRMGKSDEVARMVLILASEFASYVHGALIPVDGGFLSN